MAFLFFFLLGLPVPVLLLSTQRLFVAQNSCTKDFAVFSHFTQNLILILWSSDEPFKPGMLVQTFKVQKSLMPS